MKDYPVPEYMDLLGVPYERGARGPDAYDCYGLIRELFRRTGNDTPDFESPGTLEEAERLRVQNEHRWKRVKIGTVGAMVSFRVEGYGAHCGFMLPDDRFIHAWEWNGVSIERLTNGSFKPIASYIYE